MRRFLIVAAIFSAALAALPQLALSDHQGPNSKSASDNIPTEAERRALIERVFINQHADDVALPFFERIEHLKTHAREGDQNAIEDKVMRIVPTGIGSGRITLEDHGRRLDPSAILSQMSILEHELEMAADASNPETKRDKEKTERHAHDRAELVSALHDAFIFTWMGREMRGGRMLAKIHMEPNPSYKPTSRYADMLSHGKATVWIDESAAQLVHMEGEVTSDITIAGGIVAKVYRGGRVTLDQSEVEPGIWLPTLKQYDFTGRKFLFSTIEVHERTEISNYKRIGPPDQALAAIRREIAAAPKPARP